MQLDLGYGDVVVPSPKMADYPVILDLPVLRVRACSRETVVAEKFVSSAGLRIRIPPPDQRESLVRNCFPTRLPMSGRLDSNQRPPEPHSWGQDRFQPPNVTNASLLETYRFHSSHNLRASQRRINDLSTFSRLFPAQACPHGGDSACHERAIRAGFGAGLRK
jgi:hypothetical protein